MKPLTAFYKKVLISPLLCLGLILQSKAQAPINDEVLTATGLTVNGSSTCTVTTAGTVRNATASTGIPAFSCTTNSFLFDVWYTFTATSSTHTITLDNYGTTYTRRQFVVYQTNTFGVLSPVTCSALSTSGTTALTVTFIDYSPGTTYYVRVMYPNTVNTGPTSSNTTFRLCVTTGTNNPVQPILSGKSYTNITRPLGGTIQTGDVLEFRQSINVGNWSVNSGAIFNTTYHDTIPAGLSYVANSIKFESNEGLQVESGITGTINLTDASGDDEAVYLGGVLRVNVGSLPRHGASAAADRQYVYQGSPAVAPITYLSAGGGKIHARGRPSQFARFIVMVIRYQVTVTAATGTTFTTSNGQFRFKTTTSSTNDVTFPQTTVNFPRYTVYVSASGTSLCQGGSGVNVYAGGDFGSGTTRHDSTQLTLAPGYVWAPFKKDDPGDGFFSVVNNSSSNRNYTNKFAPFPSTGTGADTVRVFNVWDIIGDHTGATNVDSGNLAVPWGTSGGYMGVVNAAFGINTAVQKSITGLCTDTYYEFSAWFKNICAGCSTDSAGRSMGSGALFKPYLPSKTLNDSAGVSPDLTYTIDGVDYYTTGAIIYDKKWVKKGFIFRTGSTGSVNLTIRNNAPGGGGNDWAIDDIALTTCFPGMTYSPSRSPVICDSVNYTIRDTVRYIYNNYTEYKWQKWSAATSGPWTDISGTTSSGSPVWNATLGMYQYVASYTIPIAETQAANNGDRYRLVVASNSTNLGLSSCNYSDPDPIIITINTSGGCLIVASDFLSVSAKLVNNYTKLSWSTVNEETHVKYKIERSDDGINFHTVDIVPGNARSMSEKNYYSFDDPTPVVGSAYYRIGVINNLNILKKYSRNLLVRNLKQSGWTIEAVTNPFTSAIQFEINSPSMAQAKIELLDNNARLVSLQNRVISSGNNFLSIYNVDALQQGLYLLRVTINDKTETRRIIKSSN
jgi:trimeric autotransporter adhesin